MTQRFAALVALAFTLASVRAERDAIDLAGDWEVRLASASDTATVHLPGSLRDSGAGWEITPDTPWLGGTGTRAWWNDDKYAPYRQPGRIMLPFWLQPAKYYRGRAWYSRRVEIPESWRDKRIALELERPHWETAVWVDGKPAGGPQDSLSVPHRHDLTALLPPGPHVLEVRVDNDYPVDVGIDAHSVTDHTQTNWNGIVGRLRLVASDLVRIEDVQVYPDVAAMRARVRVAIGNDTGRPAAGRLTAVARHDGRILGRASRVCTATAELEVPLPGAPLWDEFQPNLITMEVALDSEAGRETRRVVFGLRDVRATDTGFTVNGIPAFMRGTLECCIFPLTGYPPTDAEPWRRIFRICRAHGLNHMRFHSWCPPEAAFRAADEAGFYLQVECGVWRGVGAPGARPVEPWLYDEADRILAEYGNHPSFVFLAHGNEPWQLQKSENGHYLNRWVEHAKALDPRHLVTAGACYPLLPESDYQNPAYVGNAWLRYHQSFNRRPPSTTRDYADAVARAGDACIAHEVGQWCVFPNLDEISKYTGVLRANNFEIVRDFMREHRLEDRANDFLMASGRFQAALYKEEIEAFLRTPGMGGFQLLDLHDFPGQGTALVGVLDAFWDEKGYITPDAFRRFAGPVVPLAAMEKRVWTSDEAFTAEVRIAQYSAAALPGARVTWRLSDGNRTLGEGEWKRTLPVGNGTVLGTVRVPLSPMQHAAKLTLDVSLPGTPWHNDWDVWVYPREVDDDAGDVLICHELSSATAALAAGRRVLWLLPPDLVAGETAGSFEPVFWNRLWFPTQKPHTLGLWIDAEHPALERFPTSFHADWQWWDPMNRSRPMILDGLPAGLRPIVQPIDDWNTCRRLGIVFEARVGDGRLVVASIDLAGDLSARPVAGQLRRSLLDYMNSNRFAPELEVSAEALTSLITPHVLRRWRATAAADSAQPDYGAENAIDGNPGTLWHTAWEPSPATYPHELVIDLQASRRLRRVRLLPRQDGNPNGRVAEVEIFLSDRRDTWGPSLLGAELDGETWTTLALPPGAAGRYLRIVAKTPRSPAHPWACLAEVDVEE